MSPENELKNIAIYTDGACLGNPGPGGYGVVLLYQEHRKELSGGFTLTTNNRMEITAAIVGLEALKSKCKVSLYSDSKYLVNSVTKGWVARWKANNWWRTKKEQAVNVDLWELLLKLCEEHIVEFHWVKGHAANKENNRCDELSVSAANQKGLPPDEGYLNSKVLAPPPSSLEEGQPCRKCLTPLTKRSPKQREPKPGQSYYYEYYFYCPGCKAMYMAEEAKRELKEVSQPLF